MKSKKHIIQTIAYLVVLVVALSVIIYQHNTIKQFSAVPPNVELEKTRWENIMLTQGFFQSYGYEGVAINYSADVSNMKGETIKLQNLLQGKNHLMLLMQVGSCRSCLYDNIVKAKELKKNGLNIIMGIDELNEQEFKSFVLQYELSDIAYRLPDKFFPAFEINPVVYFVVEKNLESRYFYSPSISFPDLTNDYVSLVEQYTDLKSAN